MNADIAQAQRIFATDIKELKNLVMKRNLMHAIDGENDFLRMYNKLKILLREEDERASRHRSTRVQNGSCKLYKQKSSNIAFTDA